MKITNKIWLPLAWYIEMSIHASWTKDKRSLTHCPLGDLDVIVKMEFSILFYWLVSSNFPMIMSSDECHRVLLMIQVMAWCRQETSHYLNQCWPRSPMPYGITRPQWVDLQPHSMYSLVTCKVQSEDTTIWHIRSLWPFVNCHHMKLCTRSQAIEYISRNIYMAWLLFCFCTNTTGTLVGFWGQSTIAPEKSPCLWIDLGWYPEEHG